MEDVRLAPSVLEDSTLTSAAGELASALEMQVPELCDVLRLQLGPANVGSLELELGGRLRRLPWELALRELLAPGAENTELVRMAAGGVEMRPFVPPWDVLWMRSSKGFRSVPQAPDAFRYYRATLTEDLSLKFLSRLGATRTHDILHFSGLHAHMERGRGEVLLGGSGEEVSAARLGRALRRASPRLVVLEAAPGSFAPLLDVGHGLAERLSSAVVVLEPAGEDMAREAAEQIYMEVVHDQPLDRTIASLRQRWGDTRAEDAGRVAFIGPHGAADILRLSSAVGRVKARRGRLMEKSRLRLDDLGMAMSEARDRGADETFIERLKASYTNLEERLQDLAASPVSYDFVRESLGQEPIVETAARTEAAEKALQEARVATRVVNTCLLADGEALATGRDVLAGFDYQLQVQIGAPSERSNRRDQTPLPDDELERFMDKDDGLALRAVVTSTDFVIHEAEKTLILPPRPRESVPSTFRVTSPRTAGVATLYLLLYFKQNLLQAIRIEAGVVSEARTGRAKGNWAETLWTLDGRLEDLDDLPERTMNLFADGARGQDHTLAFLDASGQVTARLPIEKLKRALSSARGRLLDVAQQLYGPQGDGLGDNTASLDAFEKVLAKLVHSGRQLHQALLPDKTLRRRLDALAAGPRTLQISNASTLEQAFPWALLYDRPAVGDLRLCPDFSAAIEAETAKPEVLKALPCFAAVCRYHGDKSVVCPSGFWGFRHVLEQPVSVEGEEKLRRRIPSPPLARLLMTGSARLRLFDDHAGTLKRLARLDLNGPFAAKADLLRELARHDLQIVYFYCHGVRTDELSTVLELGDRKKEYFYPNELEDLDVQWQSSCPLVFVNGCHTLDSSPEDLVSFNRSLRQCGASGIIGTEIDVTEHLAAACAHEFFTRFVEERATLGEATRHVRLWLLARRNPLGLVYTPYGHADLQLAAA